MVKAFLLCIVLLHSIYAQQDIPVKDLVDQKVQSLIDQRTYLENKAFIDIIFSPPEKFIVNNRVDVVKMIETLKENGLLKLFFNKPTGIELEFKTNGTPLFFVKIIGETLRNIGYYRFVTKSSSYDSSEFVWSVRIVSEYAADPLILQKELQRFGCFIVDIERERPTKWIYSIDTTGIRLDALILQGNHEEELHRSLFAYWLDVSKITKLRVLSKGRNNWYPDISFYDQNLHLIKVIQRDKKSYDITLVIPKNAKYIKIADIYTMKNIKDSLILKPSGAR